MDIKPPKSKQPIPPNAEKVFQGKIFEVYRWEQELYDGTKTIFEKLKRLDTVAVFPVFDDGTILLTKQEQPGRESSVSTPGGRVDKGEDILLAAKRELLEESGYEAKEFILWDARQPVTKLEWSVYTFIAKGLRKVAEPNLDGGEKIESFHVTLDELIEKATSDDFSDREVVAQFIQAKFDPKKKEELRELFKPL